MIVESRLLRRTIAVQNGGKTQIDRRIKKLLNQGAERIGFGEARELIAELEVIEDLLYVGREAVEICLKIRPELLLACARAKVAQCKLRGIIKCFPRRLSQGHVLVGNASAIK